MPTEQELIDRHAALVVEVGLNVQPGQDVVAVADEAVGTAMRLDSDDVVDEWRRHRAQLASRAEALTGLDLDAVRYCGGGTDLTVGLIPGSLWTGGEMLTDAGVEFMPNLPTEEVFTSPDRRRADGVLRTTRTSAATSRGGRASRSRSRTAPASRATSSRRSA